MSCHRSGTPPAREPNKTAVNHKTEKEHDKELRRLGREYYAYKIKNTKYDETEKERDKELRRLGREYYAHKIKNAKYDKECSVEVITEVNYEGH